MNILLGITGSVAAIKVDLLVFALSKYGTVRVVTTKTGKYFIDKSGYTGDCYVDEDEWYNTDTVLHIDMRKWADVMVVAPLSANTLAKFANGLADNLLTCIFRAWDFSKPVIIAPAMNTYMWDNIFTETQIKVLESLNIKVVQPVVKTLVCGDTGIGAMAHVEDIAHEIAKFTKWHVPVPAEYLPIGNHPGAFGVQRKHDTHTGIDFYVDDKTPVHAVERGTVVGIVPFTGASIGMPWWEETQAVLIKGISGVVLYGEIVPRDNICVGSEIEADHLVGYVKRVLPIDKRRKDITGHKTSMLHLELHNPSYFKYDQYKFDEWISKKPASLLNPTIYFLDKGLHSVSK